MTEHHIKPHYPSDTHRNETRDALRCQEWLDAVYPAGDFYTRRGAERWLNKRLLDTEYQEN